MPKLKVFISQPMNGKTKEQVEKERLSVELQGDCEILPSILECKDNPKHRSVWYLAKSLEIMAEADVVLFMKGWEEARGCQIEHEVAKQYGIKIKYPEME